MFPTKLCCQHVPCRRGGGGGEREEVSVNLTCDPYGVPQAPTGPFQEQKHPWKPFFCAVLWLPLLPSSTFSSPPCLHRSLLIFNCLCPLVPVMKRKANIHFGAIHNAVLTFIFLWPQVPAGGTLRGLNLTSLIGHLIALSNLMVTCL